jgi:hypothetical protein
MIIGLLVHCYTHNLTLVEFYEKMKKYTTLSIYGFKQAVHPKYEISFYFKESDKILYSLPGLEIYDDSVDLPDLVVVGYKGDIDRLTKFIHCVMCDKEVDEFDDILKELEAPIVKSIGVEKRDHYDYKSYLDNTRDILYCQVWRPEDETPFTVLVKNFSEKGIEPLFAHLFYSKAWGLLQSDYCFLKALWKNYNLEGEFDHEKTLEKYHEKCLPNEIGLPDEEPIVYRKFLNQLLSINQVDELEKSLLIKNET